MEFSNKASDYYFRSPDGFLKPDLLKCMKMGFFSYNIFNWTWWRKNKHI